MSSTLTSSSSDAAVAAAYEDNASYLEDQSTTKCRGFITACTILLLRLASGMTKGANALSYDRALIERQRTEAKLWLLEHTTDDADRPGPNVTRADFRSFR